MEEEEEGLGSPPGAVLEEEQEDVEDKEDAEDILGTTLQAVDSKNTTIENIGVATSLLQDQTQALLFDTQHFDTPQHSPIRTHNVKRLTINCVQVNVEPFEHEKISAVASTSKLLLLGTMIGTIHILTIRGDEIGQIHWHDGKICNISVSRDERLAISCSDDGKVAIIDTFDGKTVQSNVIPNENVTSADLHPNFRTESTYVITTTNPDAPVCVCQKSAYSFFDSTKVSTEKLVPWASGRADSIKYEKGGRYLAWSSPDGVSIIHAQSENLITILPPPKNLTKSNSQLFPCHLQWITSTESVSELVVAWGNTVQLLSIKQMEVDISNEICEVVGKDVQTFVRVNSAFEINKNLIIAGVACHKETDVILLVLNTIEGTPPSVMISDWNGKIDKSAQLPVSGIIGFGELLLSECIHSNFTSISHIVCGSNVYLLEIRDADDEIGYLLSRQKFREALQQAKVWSEANFLRSFSYENVAEQYLDALWIMGEREKFGKVLTKAGKVQPELWKIYIDRLIEKKVLQFIVEYVPVRKPRFDKKFYDKILKYLLSYDIELFVQFVHQWPAKIFHANELLKKVEKDLQKKDTNPEQQKILQEAQTALLIACGKLDSAFNQYVSITQSVMNPLKLKGNA